MAARNNGGDTATMILDVAERLVQTRGFNAFSYADVASELGITKAALHYHFAGKAELGEALLERYTTRFHQALEAIDEGGGSPLERMQAYAALYAQVLAQDRMCLCGMLAADYRTLPESMRAAVVSFFDLNEAWLAGVVEQGRTEGTIRGEGSSREVARMVVDAFEGAMLLAHTFSDAGRFASAASLILAELTSPRTAV